MPLVPVSASFTMTWLIHDSWTESYVGVRRIAYEILPPPSAKQTAEDGALCQLALVGANHLMEVALFKILRPHAQATGTVAQLTEALLEEASYFQMLTRWIPAVSSKRLDLSAEPFLSTERLRKRRNNTIHKTSALATVQMARSALYSAVEASKELYMHAGAPFPYDAHLAKYPQAHESHFSTVPFPPGT